MSDFENPSFAQLSSDERDLLRFLETHGAITNATGHRNGWLNKHSQPQGPLRRLIDKRIVAPLVSSSYPLRVEYQLRSAYKKAANEAKVQKERERLKLKDYAKPEWGRPR